MEIAICRCAFAQLRAEASHRAELVSQLKYGEPVRILSQSSDWAKIRTEHAYEGHVRMPQLQIMVHFSPENLHLASLKFSREKVFPIMQVLLSGKTSISQKPSLAVLFLPKTLPDSPEQSSQIPA